MQTAPEARLIPHEKSEPILCQSCRYILGWTDDRYCDYATWDGEPICEGCLEEKKILEYEKMSLQEFLEKLDEILSDVPEIMIYEDRITVTYEVSCAEKKRAVKLLDRRGANYGVSNNLLFITIVPDEGKLRLV